MARIDLKNKKIQAKLVYYGPGLCGKTTNLQYINDKMAKGELMSLATTGDRTIFFDFIPLDLGELWGMQVQFKLYTVPGQVRYNQTRKMVLKNVDGIVFVVDSQREMVDANRESYANLYENLSELRIDPAAVSIVLQYNKRDLPNAMSEKELDVVINGKGHKTFMASAFSGEGVGTTLKAASVEVLEKLKKNMPEDFAGGASGGTRPAAKAARASSAGSAPSATSGAPALQPKAAASAQPRAVASAASSTAAVASAAVVPAKKARPESGPVPRTDAASAASQPLPQQSAVFELLVTRFEGALAEMSKLSDSVRKSEAAMGRQVARIEVLEKKTAQAGRIAAKADTNLAPKLEEVKDLVRNVLASTMQNKEAVNRELVQLRSGIDAIIQGKGPSEALGKRDMTALRDSIAKVEAKVSAAPKAPASDVELSALRTSIASIDSKVSEAVSATGKAELAALRKSIAELSTQMTKATPNDKGSLDELKATVAALPGKADMQRLQKGLGRLAETVGPDALKAAVSHAASSAEVDKLSKQLGNLPTRADLKSLQQTMKALEGRVEELGAAGARAEVDAPSAQTGKTPPTRKATEPLPTSMAPGSPGPTSNGDDPNTAKARAKTTAEKPEATKPDTDRRASEAKPDAVGSEPAGKPAEEKSGASEPAPKAKTADAQPKTKGAESEAAKAKAESDAAPKKIEPTADTAADTPATEAKAEASSDASKEDSSDASKNDTPEAGAPKQPASDTGASTSKPATEPTDSDDSQAASAPSEHGGDDADSKGPEALRKLADQYKDDADHKNAARVARVMVADLYLYHKEEVDAGIKAGDLAERNKEAFDDMRATYESRVDEDIRAKVDYFELAIHNFVEKKRKKLVGK